MADEVEERIRDIFRVVFDLEEGAVTSELSQTSLSEWDSLQHLNLVVAIEEEFGIEFNEQEIMKSDSFGLILQVVRDKE